jgi:hypothetical protein
VQIAGGNVQLIGQQGTQATVTQADVAVCNGVVHVIDKPLIPMPAGQQAQVSAGMAAAAPSPMAMQQQGQVIGAQQPAGALGTTGAGGAGLVGAAAPAGAIAGA